MCEINPEIFVRIAVITSERGEMILKELLDLLGDYLPRGVELKIVRVPANVMSLLSADELANMIDRDRVGDADLVIVPGLIQGDISLLSKRIGKPVVRGTKSIADVPPLVRALADGVSLSESEPADKLIETYKREFEERALSRALETSKKIVIGRRARLEISRALPKVIAEIQSATIMSESEVMRMARYYVSQGADVIDIGCVAGKPRPDAVRRIVKMLRESLNVPVSVDTWDVSEIVAGMESEADLILSLSKSTIERIESDLHGIAAVIVPENLDNVSAVLKEFDECTRLLDYRRCVSILDPVLEPPTCGLTRSLHRYYVTRIAFPERPMLMGALNVTELMDADSIGINALLASIACELGVELLLTSEASVKTRGCVSELKRAAVMCATARVLRKPPKDMSTSLLVAKRKW